MPASRRRVLGLGATALAASVAGCAGMLSEESDEDSGDASSTTGPRTSADGRTTPESATRTATDAASPNGPGEFPAGPKSPPERPDDLTAATVREYVKAFEYRWVFNRLYHDETTEIHEKCGVDSVTEDGEGFRVVVWCSAAATYESDGETVHADYFTQYATYFVGPDSVVRQEGKLRTRHRE